MKESPKFLRLYVDPAWKRGDEVYSTLLFPFWGVPQKLGETHPQTKELFESYQFDTRYFGITHEIDGADMVFAPYTQQWLLRRDPALLEECVVRSRSSRLPLLVDGRADGEPPLTYENAYILRIGGYRFDQSEKGRIQIPIPADDLLMRYAGGALTLRVKNSAPPVVGFAGMVSEPKKNLYRSVRSWVKETLVRAPLYLRGGHHPAMDLGVAWRRKAVLMLGASSRVRGNFKLRRFFSGSTTGAPVPVKQLLKEMTDLLLESDYALDVRGYANASTRLFEILSLGRIPVIIDTERILPFSEFVDWRKFSLIVDFRDIRKLPDIIADFHASLSPNQFEEMQRQAREAFVRYFRVDAQMPYIIESLNKLGAFEKLR
jgi:hypothetical protein